MFRSPRILVGALVLTGALGLAACGSSDDASTTTTSAGHDSSVATSTTTTKAPSTSAVSSTEAPASSEAPATTPPAPPSTAGEPTTTEFTGDGQDPTTAALDLFTRLTAAHCQDIPIPKPVSATGSTDNGNWAVITDDAGNTLILDTIAEQVFSTDGRDGVLPYAYSFGCDPEVFVGTLDH